MMGQKWGQGLMVSCHKSRAFCRRMSARVCEGDRDVGTENVHQKHDFSVSLSDPPADSEAKGEEGL